MEMKKPYARINLCRWVGLEWPKRVIYGNHAGTPGNPGKNGGKSSTTCVRLGPNLLEQKLESLICTNKINRLPDGILGLYQYMKDYL